jgi:XTP/dITP diphosphohydrolase
MKIFFASGNEHKRKELQQLFPEHSITIPRDENIIFDPEETGSSFIENSMIKAQALWDLVHEPVIADDSGICVDCLGGIPGIYSSRFAGPSFLQGRPDGIKISQQEQNRCIIQEVNKTGDRDRTCRFICSMVFMLTPDRFFTVQETMEGCIVNSESDISGANGFGYDPIVMIPELGKTVAQLTNDEKNMRSHRGKAARAIRIFLTTI